MFTNSLPRTDALLGGMSPLEAQAAHRRHVAATDARAAAGEDTPHPSMMGYAMVLNARGNVYGDNGRVDRATVAKRRARNKAARKARRIGRNR